MCTAPYPRRGRGVCWSDAACYLFSGVPVVLAAGGWAALCRSAWSVGGGGAWTPLCHRVTQFSRAFSASSAWRDLRLACQTLVTPPPLRLEEAGGLSSSPWAGRGKQTCWNGCTCLWCSHRASGALCCFGRTLVGLALATPHPAPRGRARRVLALLLPRAPLFGTQLHQGGSGSGAHARRERRRRGSARGLSSGPGDLSATAPSEKTYNAPPPLCAARKASAASCSWCIFSAMSHDLPTLQECV